MVNPQFNVKHRLIIKKICNTQERNLREIGKIQNVKRKLEELKAEGIDIRMYEYLMMVAKDLETYKRLKKDPNQLFFLLEDIELKVLKTELLNNFSLNKETVRKLWNKLFLSEELLNQIN